MISCGVGCYGVFTYILSGTCTICSVSVSNFDLVLVPHLMALYHVRQFLHRTPVVPARTEQWNKYSKLSTIV